MFENLNISKDLFATIFQQGPVVIFVWANDTQWSVEFVSPNVKEILGYSQEEFYEKRILYGDIIHPEDYLHVVEEVKKFGFENKQNKWIHEPYRLKTKNQNYIWVRDYTIAIRDENQNLISFVGYILDITSQREYQKILEEESKKFYEFFINNPAIMLLIDPVTGKIISANQRAIEFYGYTKEQFVNLYIHQINRLNKEEIQARMRMVKERKQNFFQFPHLLADGRIREVEVYSSSIEFRNHNYLLSVIFDITPKIELQKQLEEMNTKLQELLQQEIHYRIELFKKYNLIFEQSYFGIGIIEDHHLVNSNLLLENYLSPLTLKEVQESNFFDLFDYLENVIIKEGIPIQIKQYSSVLEVRYKMNPEKYFIMFIQNFKDIKDNKKKQLVIMHDITEKKKVEKEKKDFEQMLIHQSKIVAIGESLSSLAHQWRQPLNSIGLMVQYLEQLTEQGVYFNHPEEKKIISEITNEVMDQLNFLSQTIDDFRGFFRQETEEVSFSILEEIKKVVNLLKVQLESYGIQIQLEEKDFYISGYPNLFKHAILNLINNSKDAILVLKSKNQNFKGKIFIKIIPEKKEIHVCDNGGGIPDEFLNFIFQPYFSTKKLEGSGLGLYITGLILKKMKGNIKYYHYNENGKTTGACFKIYF